MANRKFGSSALRTGALARPILNKMRTPATLRADQVSFQPVPPWRFAVGGVVVGG
jgi:hypothetical protein